MDCAKSGWQIDKKHSDQERDWKLITLPVTFLLHLLYLTSPLSFASHPRKTKYTAPKIQSAAHK